MQKEITLAQVQQIQGLRVHQILEMARQYAEIDNYMSDFKEDKQPHRDFVINFGMRILSKYTFQLIH